MFINRKFKKKIYNFTLLHLKSSSLRAICRIISLNHPHSSMVRFVGNHLIKPSTVSCWRTADGQSMCCEAFKDNDYVV